MDNKQEKDQELNFDQLEIISGGKKGQGLVCPHCQQPFGTSAPMYFYEHVRNCRESETVRASSIMCR